MKSLIPLMRMVTFPGVLITPRKVNFPLRTETVSENVSYRDNVFSQASPVSKEGWSPVILTEISYCFFSGEHARAIKNTRLIRICFMRQI